MIRKVPICPVCERKRKKAQEYYQQNRERCKERAMESYYRKVGKKG